MKRVTAHPGEHCVECDDLSIGRYYVARTDGDEYDRAKELVALCAACRDTLGVGRRRWRLMPPSFSNGVRSSVG